MASASMSAGRQVFVFQGLETLHQRGIARLPE